MLPFNHGLFQAAFPLNPPKVETKATGDLLPSTMSQANSDEPVKAYYPGTEINGFMPHRGDFATVSACIYMYSIFKGSNFFSIFMVNWGTTKN